MDYPVEGTVRLRKTKSSGSLAIPGPMLRHLANGAVFEVLWHEQGILYRAVNEEVETVEPPEWTKRLRDDDA